MTSVVADCALITSMIRHHRSCRFRKSAKSPNKGAAHYFMGQSCFRENQNLSFWPKFLVKEVVTVFKNIEDVIIYSI